MPDDIVPGRVLYLSLHRDPSVTTTPTITGWTRIGSTSGFYYYYKLASGSDDVTATWTTASVAVAVVMQLDARVEPGSIIAGSDFEATNAAAVSGLDATPRYAIAAIHA